jgi:hypothetical protein
MSKASARDPIRALAAMVGAETLWGRCEDRAAHTAPARAALYEKFLREADNDPVRAGHLWRAHFARLSLKSVAARRKAAGLLADAEAAETELRKLTADGGDAL